MSATLSKSSRWSWKPEYNANVSQSNCVVLSIESDYAGNQSPSDVRFTIVDIAKASMGANNSAINNLALKQEFDSMAKRWRDETAHSSLLRDKVVHPAYLEIIGLGSKVIPFIIERLDSKENHWFPALRAVAKENPIPNNSTFAEAVKLWKKWLKEKKNSNHGMDF
jgi:hypothetical protein